MILQHMVKNMEGAKHFQGLVKRTIKSVDRELEGKQYLVGGKVTLADLAFIPWDNMLDTIMMNDSEAATSEQRKTLYPNWAAWRDRLLQRPAVQKMMSIQKEAQSA
jgi:glutathione S-transferase